MTQLVSSEDNANRKKPNRREFLKTSAALAAAGTLPTWFATSASTAASFTASSERPLIAFIGNGGRFKELNPLALRFADCAAVCDVDTEHSTEARLDVRELQEERQVDTYGDYRKVLDRKDINAVVIATPDHWHTKISIDAMRAGKDVYCEKPLTLTIDEGKQIIQVLKATKRVFQVGTQQRSEMAGRFLKAIGIIREGRIGEIKRVVCSIGSSPKGKKFQKSPVPANLNWEMWLGQAPRVDYIPERCHYNFRWWYEYSGGKMTDWGAHHVDIAQWAIGMDHSGPSTVEPVRRVLPVPFKDGYPTVDSEFNTATEFTVRCLFPNKVELVIEDAHGNGILFEGAEGRIEVNRGSLRGQAAQELKERPLAVGLITKLYKGKKPGDHLGNFFECVKTREEPISDVRTHHRAITTCHLANIALRLGRTITWDPQAEQIVGDPEAKKFQSREQRKGFEIDA
jgi:predicted dehydrogenase